MKRRSFFSGLASAIVFPFTFWRRPAAVQNPVALPTPAMATAYSCHDESVPSILANIDWMDRLGVTEEPTIKTPGEMGIIVDHGAKFFRCENLEGHPRFTVSSKSLGWSSEGKWKEDLRIKILNWSYFHIDRPGIHAHPGEACGDVPWSKDPLNKTNRAGLYVFIRSADGEAIPTTFSEAQYLLQQARLANLEGCRVYACNFDVVGGYRDQFFVGERAPANRRIDCRVSVFSGWDWQEYLGCRPG